MDSLANQGEIKCPVEFFFLWFSLNALFFTVSDKLQRLDPVPCNDHKFQCGDGSCIHISFACDGEPDCPDHSDENPKECRVKGILAMFRPKSTTIYISNIF